MSTGKVVIDKEKRRGVREKSSLSKRIVEEYRTCRLHTAYFTGFQVNC
jgi:hypothetical protein